MIIPKKIKNLIEGSYVKVYKECSICKGSGLLGGVYVGFIKCSACEDGQKAYKLTPSEFAQLSTLQSAYEQEKKSKDK